MAAEILERLLRYLEGGDTEGFGHYSLLEGAAEGSAPDVVVSSLSKVFSGAGNCMGCATPRAL